MSTVRSPFATRSASRPSAVNGIGDQAAQQQRDGDPDADGDEDEHEDRATRVGDDLVRDRALCATRADGAEPVDAHTARGTR